METLKEDLATLNDDLKTQASHILAYRYELTLENAIDKLMHAIVNHEHLVAPFLTKRIGLELFDSEHYADGEFINTRQRVRNRMISYLSDKPDGDTMANISRAIGVPLPRMAKIIENDYPDIFVRYIANGRDVMGKSRMLWRVYLKELSFPSKTKNKKSAPLIKERMKVDQFFTVVVDALKATKNKPISLYEIAQEYDINPVVAQDAFVRDKKFSSRLHIYKTPVHGSVGESLHKVMVRLREYV